MSPAPGETTARVKSHFDRVAEEYTSFYQGSSSEAHSFTMRLTRVLAMLPPRVRTILDVGCGPGLLLQRVLAQEAYASDPGTRAIGMDFASNMVARAAGVVNGGDGPAAGLFLCGDAGRLPFPDGTVDTAVCMGLMEYLDHEEGVLAEIARVLRPGGTVIITLPNRWSPYRLWHRMLNRLFNGLKRLFPNSRRLTNAEFMVGPFTKGITHREYSEWAYGRLLRRFGIEVERVCYYNFKLFLTPLEKLFPRATVAVSRRLERLGPVPILRCLSTAFILQARKRPSFSPVG